MVATIVPEGMTYSAFKRTPECGEAYSALVDAVKAEKSDKHWPDNSHDVIAKRWAGMTGQSEPDPKPLLGMPSELEAPAEVGPLAAPLGGTEPVVSDADPVLKASMPDFPESPPVPRRRGRPPGSRNKR